MSDSEEITPEKLQQIESLKPLSGHDSEPVEQWRQAQQALGFIQQVRQARTDLDVNRDPTETPLDGADELETATEPFHQNTHEGEWRSVAEFRYEIIRKLGRGGFADVYLAQDKSLERQVAIKVLRSDPDESSERTQRFQREARAVALLDHPRIVPIFDTGVWAKRPYIVSAYCDGGTLQDYLEQRTSPLPANMAVQLLLPLVRAAHHAHVRGVVHRDLKPANIFLSNLPPSADGTAPDLLIGDFGLARSASQESPLETAAGAIVGTPAYMSPEQAAGQEGVGPAADQYALGVVLYQLLTGRLPFEEKQSIQLLMDVIHKPVPTFRSRGIRIDRDLEAICLKCLEKRPQDRYESLFQCCEDLLAWQDGRPVRARRVNAATRFVKWFERNPALGFSLVTGLLLLGFSLQQWYVSRIERLRADRHSEKSQEVIKKFTTNVGTTAILPPQFREDFLLKAVREYDELLADEPGNLELYQDRIMARFWLASLLTDLGRWEDAEVVLNRAQNELVPYTDDERFAGTKQRLVGIRLKVEQALGDQQGIAEQQQILQTQVIPPSRAAEGERHLNLGLAHFVAQRLGPAIEQFQKAEAAFSGPFEHEFAFEPARTQFFWARTLMAQTEAILSQKNSPSQWEQAHRLLAEANDRTQNGIQDYLWMLDHKPEDDRVLEELAKAHMQAGEVRILQLQIAAKDVESEGRQVGETSARPDDVQRLCHEARQHFETAVDRFQELQDRHPSRPRIYGLLAMSLEQWSRLEEQQRDVGQLDQIVSRYRSHLQTVPHDVAEYPVIWRIFVDIQIRQRQVQLAELQNQEQQYLDLEKQLDEIEQQYPATVGLERTRNLLETTRLAPIGASGAVPRSIQD